MVLLNLFPQRIMQGIQLTIKATENVKMSFGMLESRSNGPES